MPPPARTSPQLWVAPAWCRTPGDPPPRGPSECSGDASAGCASDDLLARWREVPSSTATAGGVTFGVAGPHPGDGRRGRDRPGGPGLAARARRSAPGHDDRLQTGAVAAVAAQRPAPGAVGCRRRGGRWAGAGEEGEQVGDLGAGLGGVPEPGARDHVVAVAARAGVGELPGLFEVGDDAVARALGEQALAAMSRTRMPGSRATWTSTRA